MQEGCAKGNPLLFEQDDRSIWVVDIMICFEKGKKMRPHGWPQLGQSHEAYVWKVKLVHMPGSDGTFL